MDTQNSPFLKEDTFKKTIMFGIYVRLGGYTVAQVANFGVSFFEATSPFRTTETLEELCESRAVETACAKRSRHLEDHNIQNRGH